VTQVIYKIINLVNDKFYVGSTVHKKVRFRQHRRLLRNNRHHCKHLQAAWNKYGEDKFDFRVVEEVADSESLEAVEDRWLSEHVGKEYCYNSGYSAKAPWRGAPADTTPSFGRLVKQQTKEQISTTLKAFYAEDYNNHPRVGKTHSEETKERIRQAKLSNPTAYWEGKERSEETKAKIADTQRGNSKTPGRKVSEEGRAKIRAAAEAGHYSHWEGRNHTEESKDKMRRPIYAILPDGTRRDFAGTALAGEELGVPYPMLVRAMKARKPLVKGKLAGWLFAYTDDPVELPALVETPEEFKDYPRTRQEAKDKGAKFYFTGQPCTHGHISPRLTKGTCVACRKAGLA
jgi:group I intron endonuclease